MLCGTARGDVERARTATEAVQQPYGHAGEVTQVAPTLIWRIWLRGAWCAASRELCPRRGVELDGLIQTFEPYKKCGDSPLTYTFEV